MLSRVVPCISTVGITNRLNYMDVDFQANLNLLEEAKRSGVKKFIYVAVLNGEKLTHLKICEGKEKGSPAKVCV